MYVFLEGIAEEEFRHQGSNTDQTGIANRKLKNLSTEIHQKTQQSKTVDM